MSGSIYDEAFANVDTLLHLDGTNGSTTFTDTGNHGFTWAATGSAQLSNAESKWGTCSLSPGTGYISTSVSSYDSGNGVWECWINTSSSNPGTVFCCIDSSAGTGTELSIDVSGHVVGTIYRFTGTSQNVINTSIAVNDGNWHHVALWGFSGNYNVMVDGTVSANYTGYFQLNSVNGLIAVGALVTPSGMSNNFQGYISDFRHTTTGDLTHGNGTFQRYMCYANGLSWPTPPAQFPDSGPPSFSLGDPYYGNVAFLLHMNGTNGSTSFPDSGPNNVSFTPTGGMSISTATQKWGSGSGYWPSPTTNEYLNLSLTAYPVMGDMFAEDFTIEFWYYDDNNYGGGGDKMMWAWGETVNANAGPMFRCYLLQSAYDPYVQVLNASPPTGGTYNDCSWATNVAGSGIPAVPGYNAWYHYAFVKLGGSVVQYVNGVSAGGALDWQPAYTSPSPAPVHFNIGSDPTSSGVQGTTWSGFMQDFRVTVGVARYLSNFFVPSAQFPNSGTQATVPNLVGVPAFTGIPEIFAASLTLGTISYAYSNTYAVGEIISTSPAGGSSEPYGTAVNVTVSEGPVPNTAIYGKFVAAPAVTKAVMVANIGDIEPKVWRAAEDDTVRTRG